MKYKEWSIKKLIEMIDGLRCGERLILMRNNDSPLSITIRKEFPSAHWVDDEIPPSWLRFMKKEEKKIEEAEEMLKSLNELSTVRKVSKNEK